MEKKILLRQIDDYSKCPNFAKYNLNSLEKYSREFSIFRHIVLSAYRDLQNIQTIPTWPTLRNRVTKQVIKDVDVSNSEELSKAYKFTKVMLDKVHQWYGELIAGFPGEALVNVEISNQLGKTGVTVTGIADVILLYQDQVTLIDIVERPDISQHQVTLAYNSIKLQSLMWLLQSQGIEVTDIVRVIYKPDGIDFAKLKMEKLIPGKVERRLHLIVTGIANEIYYPSVTSMCSTCPYKSICTW